MKYDFLMVFAYNIFWSYLDHSYVYLSFVDPKYFSFNNYWLTHNNLTGEVQSS